jgi:hypothetical protein
LANHGGDESSRAADRAIWSDEELADLSVAERKRLLVWIVETIEADVGEALASGSFLARSDAHAIRNVLQVDERGWSELSQIHLDVLDSVLRIQAASAERLAETGEIGVPALAALFCCELPQGRVAEG